MKPSLSTATSDALPCLSRPNSAESGYHDSFGPNIYAFQEGEDVSGNRSRGYQKPKQMWMAKDQALTEQTKQTSPNGSSSTNPIPPLHSQMMHISGIPEFTPQCCPQSKSSQSSSQPLQSSNTTPPRTGYLGCSPSTTGSAPGTVAALSSSMTNTSNSLSSHTPPPCVNGLSNAGSASSCASPSPGEPTVYVKTNGPVQCVVPDLNSDPVVKLRTPTDSALKHLTKTARKPLATTRRQRLPTTKSGVAKGDNRRRKSNRAVKKSSELPLQFTQPSASITLTLNLSSLTSSTLCKPAAKSVPAVRARYSTATQARTHSSLSLPSSGISSVPGAVGSGLKIRLRRDPSLPSAGSSRPSGRSKISPDVSSTFRIVESWCDADAPGGEFSRRRIATGGNSPASSTAASTVGAGSVSGAYGAGGNGFHVGDIVWAKLAGYPYWPSRINALWARNLHQLAQVPQDQHIAEDADSTNLAVTSTPIDPASSAGFTARVDWLAWDQCSYLSCAKLYSFTESYDRLYNPRTRVKGYADAVRLAKRLIHEKLNPDDVDAACNLPITGHMPAASPTIEPQPPASQEMVLAEVEQDQAVDLSCDAPPPPANGIVLASQPTSVNDATLGPEDDLPELDCSALATGAVAVPGGGWAPLPQLDISGFGDFHVSHVPTFSEDEEEDAEANVANQLRINLSPSM